MGRSSKDRGYRWEKDTARFLTQETGHVVKRYGAQGAVDLGDLRGVPDWTLECKDRHPMDISGALAEAKAESENAGTPFYAAIVKRRRQSAGEAYVVTDLATHARHLEHVRHLTVELERVAGQLESLQGALRGALGDNVAFTPNPSRD